MTDAWRDPRWFDELPSTNGWLAERLRAASPDERPPPGTVVAARRQTAGRGRQGRAWRQEAGRDLAVSFVVAAPEDPRDLGALGMAAALGVAEWLVRRGGVAGLKWPNDVLALPRGADAPTDRATGPDAAGWRKLAGTLVETVGAWAVVGVGVNLSADGGARQAADRPAISAAEALAPSSSTDNALTPEAVLAELLRPEGWPDLTARWRAAGFAGIRARWEALAVGVGASVATAGGGAGRRGVLEGFGLHGEARVRGDDGALNGLWVEVRFPDGP